MKYYAPTKLSENILITPEGYLLCIGVPVARTGDMEYLEGETPIESDNGKVIIKRTEAEVFRPETIASFEGKPFTIKHPDEFVHPKNWKDLAVGIMQNVRRGEGEHKDDLICDILVTDEFAIYLVQGGLRGLSCGYEADYEQLEVGKGIQKNIIGNHLALVEEGRAGLAYAINDSKGDNFMNKSFATKLKLMFSKAVDEAAKEEKEESKDMKEESKDMMGYDELVKMMKDMGAKLEAMAPKDEKKDEPKEKEQKDEEIASGLEDRLKALEMKVDALIESMSSKENEQELIEDEELEDEEKEIKLTADEVSRAEILAPGLKRTKDLKANALKAAYATKDGKKIIDLFTNGKTPDYANEDKIDHIFIAASEVIKSQRTKELLKTKTNDDYVPTIFNGAGHITAEAINELNKKHYKLN